MGKRLDYRTTSPEAMKALLAVHSYLENCGLEASLLELVYLRCSQINGCAYCLDMHAHKLVKDGIPVDKLILLSSWREASALFSLREQVALAWAERVTRISEAPVNDKDYENSLNVFSEKELSDLTFAVALINAFNRLAISFEAEPAAVKRALQLSRQSSSS